MTVSTTHRDDRIRRLVAALAPSQPDPAALSDEARLVDDLEYDSVMLVDLTVGLEEAFGLPQQPAEELSTVRTVGDVVALIERMSGGGA